MHIFSFFIPIFPVFHLSFLLFFSLYFYFLFIHFLLSTRDSGYITGKEPNFPTICDNNVPFFLISKNRSAERITFIKDEEQTALFKDPVRTAQ